ncbi:hypothetical protein [Labedaea rhizosphaerae]|uniref:Serine/threonine-protein kinase RsbW n=1 Tax=Labedaea rhizosphaerae TaxID=598644 RepID=A0A4R6SFF9_LABRH|nr:hypothetical protein [Labedaea rhizosphaerae]TDQ00742.1 serine/threonine-protein kinase RsbW [Labedaea rhizosphaerae]
MPPDDDEFVLEAPATAHAAPVVRAMAAAVVMAHDFPLEEITDIRLAVDEACSLLLPLAAPGTKVCCAVRIDAGVAHSVEVMVRVASAEEGLPDSVDLQILRALATDLKTWAEPDGEASTHLLIRMLMTRANA